MDGSGILSAASGATPVSPTSPLSARHAPNGHNKRKRGSMVADSSPGSPGGQDDDTLDLDSKKRQPGVKRACNECRQQKVSHHTHNCDRECDHSNPREQCCIARSVVPAAWHWRN